ncbi:MAG: tetratricopeptide repeat protein [Planctomycetota bacterium]
MLFASAAGVWSCAGTVRTSEGVLSTEGVPQGIVQLTRLAERQRRRPDQTSMDAPPPPGVPIEAIALIDESAPSEAGMPLAAAVDRFAGEPIGIDPFEPFEVSQEDRLRALRSYAVGRASLLSGDARSARTALEAAARADPNASEPWRELGQLALAQQNAPLAATMFRRAASRDPDDVLALAALAGQSIDSREFDAALPILARLRAMDLAGIDAALPAIANAWLGRALLTSGYVRAGADALEDGLALPDTFSSGTRFGRELQALYRDRGSLWRDVGDAHMRLGDADAALEAYERAEQLPLANPDSIAPRKVASMMRVGRPAAAGARIVSEIVDSGGLATDRQAESLAYLAQNSGVGDALYSALTDLPGALPSEQRRAARRSLIRVRAAVISDSRARSLLRSALAERPRDEIALRDLLGRYDEADRAGIVREVEGLIDAVPTATPAFTDALVRRFGGVRTAREGHAETTPTFERAHTLLGARLSLAAGFAGDALRSLQAIEPSDAVLLGITEAHHMLGEDAQAFDVLDRVTRDDPASRSERARLLAVIGEQDSALAEYESLAQDEANAEHPALAEWWARAGELALLAGDLDRAERAFRSAIEAEPGSIGGYSGLLTIQLSRRDVAARETASRLREEDPSSPVLRWLRAQEATASERFQLAERELLDLCEEYPEDDRYVRLLGEVWRRTNADAKAESWLRDRIERYPSESIYTLELAQLLVRVERADEAATSLRAHLDRFPGDAGVSRRLESVLRARLGRADEADALTLERLERARPTAQTRLERVELAARARDVNKLTVWFEELMDEHAPLTRNELIRLDQAFSAIGAEPFETQRENRAAVALFDRILEERTGVELSTYHAHGMLEVAAWVEPARAASSVLNAVRDLEGDDRLRLVLARLQQYGQESIDAGFSERSNEARRAIDAIGQRLSASPEMRSDVTLLAFRVRLGADAVNRVRSTLLSAVPGELAADPRANLDVARSVLEQAVRDTIAAEQLGPVVERLTSALGQRAEPADGAVFLARLLAAVRVRDVSESLYRFAIEARPRDPDPRNSLGYALLLQERVSEAAPLLDAVYELDGVQNAAYTDSIGLLRLMQSRLDDEFDENGDLVSPGALTLLERAAELTLEEMRNQRNFIGALKQQAVVINAHLGDALWVAGRSDEAIAAWDFAAATYLEIDDQVEGPLERIDDPNLEEVRWKGRSAAESAADARAGREPRLRHGPIDPDDESPERRGAVPQGG